MCEKNRTIHEPVVRAPILLDFFGLRGKNKLFNRAFYELFPAVSAFCIIHIYNVRPGSEVRNVYLEVFTGHGADILLPPEFSVKVHNGHPAEIRSNLNQCKINIVRIIGGENIELVSGTGPFGITQYPISADIAQIPVSLTVTPAFGLERLKAPVHRTQGERINTAALLCQKIQRKNKTNNKCDKIFHFLTELSGLCQANLPNL